MNQPHTYMQLMHARHDLLAAQHTVLRLIEQLQHSPAGPSLLAAAHTIAGAAMQLDRMAGMQGAGPTVTRLAEHIERLG